MDVQKRIILKAFDLVKRYGVRAVTLDDIASSAGISKKTIYQYFDDKDALVDAVMMGEMQHNNQKCEECCNSSKNAVEEIFKLIEKMDDNFKSLNPIIFLDLKKYHHKTFEKFQYHLHTNLKQMIIANLQRGITEGLYRPDIDVEIVARFRIACIWLLFDQEVYPASEFTLHKVSLEIFELFLYGLVNPKGYKLIEKYKQKNNSK